MWLLSFQILNSITASITTLKKDRPSDSPSSIDEKANLLQKSLESIELGIEEAQVS